MDFINAQSARISTRKTPFHPKPPYLPTRNQTMSTTKRFSNATGSLVADNTNIMTAEPPLPIEGEGAHWAIMSTAITGNSRAIFSVLMTLAQQQALFENTARAMGDARRHIKERHIANCLRADPADGRGVARALGLDLPLAAE